METFWKKSENGTFLRVIKTARTEDRINEAAYEGFFPLVKKVQPSDEIHSKFMVVQDKSSGRITVVHDIRTSRFGDLGFGDPIVTEFDGPPDPEMDNNEVVIPWSNYYPHSFPSPFAAYLIPHDIEKGERVYVEDVIEDVVGDRWNQGDTYRLASCEAIWNGSDLELQHRPLADDEYNIIG